MIVFELVGRTESHPEYQRLEAANHLRQGEFLESLIFTALKLDQRHLSQTVIKALNHHAIACLHPYAGDYRPCAVSVGQGSGQYLAPDHYRVPALMDDFVNTANRGWDGATEIGLAAYVLWRLNWIHPFINGNGRTARAACYYVLCLKAGGLLPGREILPALLLQHRIQYVDALKHADQGDLDPLTALILRLLEIQLDSI